MGYTKFTIRTSRPVSSDKFVKCYNNSNAGGWSEAVNGKPTDPQCNVLSNCVGYAQGRFCEIYNEIMGTTGNKYKYLNCNAENFIERAQKTYPELEMGDAPRPGAIICWQKGPTTSSSDGAGHVEVVERVIDDEHIETSASAWGSATPFYVQQRAKGDGNWGQGSEYKFRSFIYNPAVQYVNDVVEPVARDESVEQIQVLIDMEQRVRVAPGLDKDVRGHAKAGYYNYSRTVDADGYTWYEIAADQWVAGVSGRVAVLAKRIKHSIEIQSSVHCKLTVSQTSAYCGDTIEVVVTPDEGYQFWKVCWNNEIITTTSFIMPDEDVVLSAVCTRKLCVVSWDTYGGRKIETYEYGDMPRFKGDATKPSDERYSYNLVGWEPELERVTKPAIYTAKYEAQEILYKVTADEISHGVMTLSASEAPLDTLVTVQVTPDENYVFDHLIVDGLGMKSLEFKMPPRDITVGAVFNRAAYDIHVAETEHGRCEVSANHAAPGAQVIVYYYPDENYELNTATVNGEPITEDNIDGAPLVSDGERDVEWTKGLNGSFIMPAQDAEIVVTFKKVSFFTWVVRTVAKLFKSIFSK